jgi:cell division protein FtsI (penicillin-binding protein 3)
VLTIDSRIQYLVETHLKQAVQDKGAKGGVAIVMDPKTGEILALANERRSIPTTFGAHVRHLAQPRHCGRF